MSVSILTTNYIKTSGGVNISQIFVFVMKLCQRMIKDNQINTKHARHNPVRTFIIAVQFLKFIFPCQSSFGLTGLTGCSSIKGGNYKEEEVGTSSSSFSLGDLLLPGME